jgi:imidazolonepropionase-like amidohydrolase
MGEVVTGFEVERVYGRVLVGPDEERDGLRVVGGRITFEPAPAGASVRTSGGPGGDRSGGGGVTVRGWVLPGLVDAHCHVGLGPGGAVDRETTERQILDDRASGALLLRDAGSPADTRWVDGRDDLPRLVRAGRHIARTRRYLRNYGHEIEPDELPAYAAREARAGDGWVKLVGDWLDRSSGDLAPCWPREALVEAIKAAHAGGARVTAHCFSESSLVDLVEAGIDCIEHACGLTDDTIALFAQRAVPIVPTMVNIATFARIADDAAVKFPVYARHMRDLHARRYETVRAAYDAGLAIFAGTDAGGSLPHGILAQEVSELARAGLPTVAALSSATWAAREWMGFPGLTEGAEADFVVYPADPRADLDVLMSPSVIVRGGKAVAGTDIAA